MAEIFKNNESPEPTKINIDSKIGYWDDFAKKHIPELRLLFRGGKLWSKEGWRNVVEHSLPQGAAVEVLLDMLQFPEKEKQKLITCAICHDWDKHLEKKLEDFATKDYEKISKFIEKIELSPDLLAATKSEFVNQIVSAEEKGEETPINQLIMFYVDDITMGGGENIGGFGPFEVRFNEEKKRNPQISPEQWEKEKEAGNIAQNRIYKLLREKGVLIEKPEDLPSFITDAIENKYK